MSSIQSKCALLTRTSAAFLIWANGQCLSQLLQSVTPGWHDYLAQQLPGLHRSPVQHTGRTSLPVCGFLYFSIHTHRAGCTRTDGRTDRLHHLHNNNNGLHKEASAPTILLGPKCPLPFSYCLVCFPFLLLRVPPRALPSGPFMLPFTNNKILITNTSVWCQPPRGDGSDGQDLSLSLSFLNLQSLLRGPRIVCVCVLPMFTSDKPLRWIIPMMPLFKRTVSIGICQVQGTVIFTLQTKG